MPTRTFERRILNSESLHRENGPFRQVLRFDMGGNLPIIHGNTNSKLGTVRWHRWQRGALARRGEKLELGVRCVEVLGICIVEGEDARR